MHSNIPLQGEYFLFQLDPSESLRDILDDEEVAEACTELGLRCQIYIGCCTAWQANPKAGLLFPLKLSIVSRGLPSYPEFLVHGDMSLPIYPTTFHPQGRKPLVVDPPLPWEDCYHCTLAMTTVLVRCLELDPRRLRGKYALMPRQQTTILRFQQDDDERWREKLVYMKATGGNDFLPDLLDDQESVDELYEFVKGVPDAGGALSWSHLAGDEELQRRLAHDLKHTAVVDITTELEAVGVEDLANNAYDFFKELDELEDILAAYETRVADAKRRNAAVLDEKVASARSRRRPVYGDMSFSIRTQDSWSAPAGDIGSSQGSEKTRKEHDGVLPNKLEPSSECSPIKAVVEKPSRRLRWRHAAKRVLENCAKVFCISFNEFAYIM